MIQKSSERYKNAGFSESDNNDKMMMEDEPFEDSFSHDIGDSSASNKKYGGGGFTDDDSIVFTNNNTRVGKFDENSPPPTELVKTKNNLIK